MSCVVGEREVSFSWLLKFDIDLLKQSFADQKHNHIFSLSQMHKYVLSTDPNMSCLLP